MNTYMNRVTMEMFSYFDTGKSAWSEPERFYHGFVLGLMVEPRKICDAIIIEFKVQDEEEADLTDTVSAALRQIEEKDYQASLTA